MLATARLDMPRDRERGATHIARRAEVDRGVAAVGGGIVDFFQAAAVHDARAAVATTAAGVGALQVLEFVLEGQLRLVGVGGAFRRHRVESMGGSREIRARRCVRSGVQGVAEESRCLVVRCPRTGSQREENKMTAKGPSVNDVGAPRSGSSSPSLPLALLPLAPLH